MTMPQDQQPICAEPGCSKLPRSRGFCKTHYKKAFGAHWSTGDPEARKARDRAKTHRRRYASRVTDVTTAYEQQLRAKARRCPICRVKLIDEPYQPASKELDHMVPLGVGGTHTIGNARCLACDRPVPRGGVGRPRKYCSNCRPIKMPTT